MDDRTNTISGWVLFSGIVALGLSSLSARYFLADKDERPETMGFAIAGVASGEGGAAKDQPIEALLATADAAKGEQAFKKCTSCHTINQGGAAGIGPNLFAVVGRAVGGGSFGYSEDLKKLGGNWDWQKLDAWLKSPKAMAAGTKMTFAGLTDPAERANVILYLNAQGSNLPLPAVPAAAAADAAAPAEAAKVAGDPAKGEQSFKKCTSCHTINAGGANGIGPNLAGIYGKGVGAGSFAYSDGLKGKGGNWDDATLDAWLTSPKSFAEGTKMTFAGLPDAGERANVIAYLKAQSGK